MTSLHDIDDFLDEEDTNPPTSEENFMGVLDNLPAPTANPTAHIPQQDPSEVPHVLNAVDEKMALDVALGETPVPLLLDTYKLTHIQFDAISNSPAFMQRVEQWKEQLSKNGMSMRVKAALLAEAMLPQMFALANNPTIDPKTRVDVVKWLSNVGGVGEKNAENQLAPATGGFSINIVFPDKLPNKSVVIDHDD